MKRVFVTGCAGFIGSNLVEKLLDLNYKVVGIDNFDNFYPRSVKEENLSSFLNHPDFTFIEGDITNSSDLPKGAFDAVIHLAAKAGVRPSIENPDAYVKSNVVGTQNILSWMTANGCQKMVFASSSSIYGNNKKVPFTEDDNVDQPISPYAATKRACELLNYTAHHLHHLDIVNLRFFTVYGPRQRPDLAIHKFNSRISNDQPIEMFGDGSTARDYTFVNDTVGGIVKCLDYVMGNTGVYEIVNLGNKNPVKLSDLISKLYALYGKEPQVKVLPMQAGDVDITYAEISKGKALFGYQPEITIDEGLKRFYEWFCSIEKVNK